MRIATLIGAIALAGCTPGGVDGRYQAVTGPSGLTTIIDSRTGEVKTCRYVQPGPTAPQLSCSAWYTP